MLKMPRVVLADATRQLCFCDTSRWPMPRVTFSVVKRRRKINLEKYLFNLLFARK